MSTYRNRLDDVLHGLAPDHLVLSSSDGVSLSAVQMRDQLDQMSATLAELPQGTRVATLLPDAPMTAISLLAMVHHVQVMPINPALSDREISDILQRGEAQILMAATRNLRARDLAADIPLATIEPSGAMILPKMQGPAHAPGLILLTSGSTGTPKRVPLTPEQLHLSAERIARTLELGPDDRAVHALPMFHIGAIVDLLLAPLYGKGSVHFAGGMGADALRSSVMDHGSTWLQLVPTMLARLQTDLSADDAHRLGEKLRFIRSVSSDLAPHVQEKAEAFFAGTPIIQMYGMTETAGQITTNPLPPKQRKLGSVGQAIDIDLRISDGEIQLRGPCVTTGYEDHHSSDQFTEDGWLRTGDLGRLDADGFLYLSGRSKEMINRGGEKISPYEIEHAALNCASVVEAAAFALPHVTLGEEVGLAVTLKPDAEIDSLQGELKKTLADFKQPRRILQLDPLPRLGSGKIDRRALARMIHVNVSESPQVQHTGIAALVAQAWRAVLPEADSAGPHGQDDFFDAGGDSLSAAQFLFEVERLTGKTLAGNLLFEAPEFDDFVAHVARAAVRQSFDEADPKHRFLRKRLEEWDAPDVAGTALLRGLYQDAPARPLFWCVQEEGEYQQLAQAFAQERPLYLMRSLFLMLGKNDTMSRELAQDYAAEIARLQPEGALCLGGFCEGAKIMGFVADALVSSGRQVQVLISWDQWFDAETAAPVLHLWSDDRYERYSKQHLFPERAIARAHPLGYDVIRIPGGHTDVLTQGPLAPYLSKIRQALDHGINAAPEHQHAIFEKGVHGEVKLSGPGFARKGAKLTYTLHIHNKGAEPWSASAEVPLYAALRLKNLDGHIRSANVGRVEITSTIGNGEKRTMSLSLDVPDASLPVWIEADVFDSASLSGSEGGLTQRRKLLIINPF